MGRTHQVVLLAAAIALGAGTHADAQTLRAESQTLRGGWELRVTNVVSPAQPTTNVEIWAWWDEVPANPKVFGGGNMDLVAERGKFQNVTCLVGGVHGCGNSYASVGSRLNDLSPGQLHLPALGIFGSPDNPLHLLDVQWTTTDFSTVRSVGLLTENTYNFIVADWATGATTQIFPQGFTPGSGVIQVVPAPAAGWIVFALSIGWTRRVRTRTTGRILVEPSRWIDRHLIDQEA
jgi:hypothetical protein